MARSRPLCVAKLRERNLNPLFTCYFAARDLSKCFVDSLKLLGSSVVHAAATRFDIARELRELFLVFLGPSFGTLQELLQMLGWHDHSIAHCPFPATGLGIA